MGTQKTKKWQKMGSESNFCAQTRKQDQKFDSDPNFFLVEVTGNPNDAPAKPRSKKTSPLYTHLRNCSLFVSPTNGQFCAPLAPHFVPHFFKALSKGRRLKTIREQAAYRQEAVGRQRASNPKLVLRVVCNSRPTILFENRLNFGVFDQCTLNNLGKQPFLNGIHRERVFK